MDFIWILFAFVCGLTVKFFSLPPLIGFLFAGFSLHFMGIEPTASLDSLADLGITLMLFTIGLKLHVKDLLKREIWVSTLSHMGLWTLLFGSLSILLSIIAFPFFLDMDIQTAALLGFALSFSSTVCIIKLLEESGEIKTRHGQIAIGVLVMQDIAAVIFLVFATGKTPSIWALALFGLIFIRPFLDALLNRAGHGEMLPLTGFFLALGGYELFTLVGVKGDLGALLFGVLLSHHAKASELTKSLLSFKDLFLIGFFLSIGFIALPTWPMLGMAAIISCLIVVKFAMFFLIFTRLQLRGRTSFLSALALSNFSEFGLIVAALSVESGWLNKEWLVILALAVSLSFILTSVFYRHAHQLYSTYKEYIKKYESPERLREDLFIQPPHAEILVIGLGRVGKGAFKALQNMVDQRVVGMDADRLRIKEYQQKGMNVFFGDGEDADLWENFDTSTIKLILLALPSIEDDKNITTQLRKVNYQGQIAAIARFQDERELLLNSGIDNVFNFYTEAGIGFAEESLRLIGEEPAIQHAL
ncbi:cation:proton antiporter family protein [Neptunomonas antarctica]|uniref:Transporter, CPA2 family n=1 Tax=Neptunomonas antarctica TaxID=619304 RepID=A0A1N7KBF0_9GAMM|nr:cation:proton antiporter family protein [Neptunomonas antarctica]SIS58925.1 transporter, CPA2 family [Neptunomonas antarctica]